MKIENKKVFLVKTESDIKSIKVVTLGTIKVEETYCVIASHEHFAKAWVAARCGSDTFNKEHQAKRQNVSIKEIVEIDINAIVEDESLVGILGN